MYKHYFIHVLSLYWSFKILAPISKYSVTVDKPQYPTALPNFMPALISHHLSNSPLPQQGGWSKAVATGSAYRLSQALLRKSLVSGSSLHVREIRLCAHDLFHVTKCHPVPRQKFFLWLFRCGYISY